MIKKSHFINLIHEGNFRELFISELGWNRYRGQTQLPPLIIDNIEYNITAIAERSGFQILTCDVDELPTQSLAKKIDSKLRRQANDYICIFRQRDTQHDLWVVPVRSNEKRDIVLVECDHDKADFLFSKIDGLYFDLEENIGIVDLRDKVQGAFAVNSEKITKDFYAGFKKEHKAFADFITGIDDHIETKSNRNKQWYTSVMLNRLMFCYFIQKKGFLNLDFNYLRNKLNWVRQEQGENRFFKSFYSGFLNRLFHDGLNSPHHDCDFEQMYGKIPYLNGGMFDEHQLERDYADIDIADEAFIRLFDFFDTWRWHLDTRLTASGKDINPDVLGYIFEQYINDRAQMGAYYTKEDITEYIGKNCILPFLIDRLAEKMPAAFKPEGFVWNLLRHSGDRYIYDAVRKGYTADWRSRIPANIAIGLDTDAPDLLGRRVDWNTRAPEDFALPTEIWRETIERFKRCDDILAKISNGNIRSINDFITYNLDIRSFVFDIVATTDDHHFVRHFYDALQSVTILDPTCGSGAFLFAAMNILEPLYEISIERIQEFNAGNPNLFKKQLDEISNKYRSNIQYFIFKSIILRNLYGVDIMVEATEIAKLRLFLKMVAVVDVDRRAKNLGLDPLPDIDFNIRCGNTLVGYANEHQLDADLSDNQGNFEVMLANDEFKSSIEAQMQIVARVYQRFKELQMEQEMNMVGFKQAKHELRVRLDKLNDLLNHRLFQASGLPDYDKYLETHQPFNWLAEFYQIIHDNGGFDVIIGNPPYVTFTDSTLKYRVSKYSSYPTKNLFALVGERCTEISKTDSSIGYIIPLSGLSIDGFESFQRIIFNKGSNWSSFYSGDRNPSELFTGVKIRAAIYIHRPSQELHKFMTRYIKYYANERQILFSKINYTEFNGTINAPKVASSTAASILRKIIDCPSKFNKQLLGRDYIYYHAAPIYWGKAIMDLNYLKEHNLNIADSYKQRTVVKDYKDFLFGLLNSTLFFFYWITMSDCYNLTKSYISNFAVPQFFDTIKISQICSKLNSALFETSKIAEYEYKNKGSVKFAQFFPKQSKKLIDEIDKLLGIYYNLTDEEVDFIINYDIKYRMGDELNDAE